MPNLALITGASSGIGRELARFHAGLGGDMIITARRDAELQALKSELESKYYVTVHTISLDLGAPGGADDLAKQAMAIGPIEVLINNAGFGGHGAFIDRDLAADHAMVDLNVSALMTLCHHFGRDMAARGGGKILNVSSTASYMPGPLQATYFATKAFVSSFSQALDEELRDKGVTVTALEPGAVATEFMDTADLNGTDLAKGGASAADVAAFGYRAMMAGELRAINETRLQVLMNWVMPFLPRRRVLKMVRSMQTK